MSSFFDDTMQGLLETVAIDKGKMPIKQEGNMYEYQVYNETRKSYCTVLSESLLYPGQCVLMNFDNEELKGELCKCQIIETLGKIVTS